MRGGRLGERGYSQPGLREHLRKYNIDNNARRRLSAALAVLRDYEDQVQLALSEGEQSAHRQLCNALYRMVHGHAGEFR